MIVESTVTKYTNPKVSLFTYEVSVTHRVLAVVFIRGLVKQFNTRAALLSVKSASPGMSSRWLLNEVARIVYFIIKECRFGSTGMGVDQIPLMV